MPHSKLGNFEVKEDSHLSLVRLYRHRIHGGLSLKAGKFPCAFNCGRESRLRKQQLCRDRNWLSHWSITFRINHASRELHGLKTKNVIFFDLSVAPLATEHRGCAHSAQSQETQRCSRFGRCRPRCHRIVSCAAIGIGNKAQAIVGGKTIIPK